MRKKRIIIHWSIQGLCFQTPIVPNRSMLGYGVAGDRARWWSTHDLNPVKGAEETNRISELIYIGVIPVELNKAFTVHAVGRTQKNTNKQTLSSLITYHCNPPFTVLCTRKWVRYNERYVGKQARASKGGGRRGESSSGIWVSYWNLNFPLEFEFQCLLS